LLYRNEGGGGRKGQRKLKEDRILWQPNIFLTKSDHAIFSLFVPIQNQKLTVIISPPFNPFVLDIE
jgi:hypothetical protein